MITVILIDEMTDTKIRHYDTDSEEEACRLLLTDWQNGELKWEFDRTSESFTPEWIAENGFDPLELYVPEYENGVRVMIWHCVNGPKESDDEIVRGYFLHTTKTNQANQSSDPT